MNTKQSQSGDGHRVCVIGAGYVGLPTAAILARRGHSVVLAERDPKRLESLQRGEVPIFEPGLDAMLAEAVEAGRLRFTSSAAEAVVDQDFVFLCVATPQGDDGAADLSYVKAAATEIGPHLASGAIVINKSTVPVGTVGLVERALGRDDVAVVSNPEFLREGTAVADSLSPDRIVVGSHDPRAATAVAELFGSSGAAMVITDPTTAETIKYASNAFLATKITFINSMAAVCEAVGADVRDLVLGMGFDKRIGFEFLRPGPGWGGSCFPKDTSALVHIAAEHGFDFSLLRVAIECNEEQMDRMVDKMAAAAGGLDGVTVAVWGLTFKANTDDRRSSPATAIVARLLSRGAIVRAYDPTVSSGDATTPDLAGVEVFDDAIEATRGAAVLGLLTEWQEFRWVDFDKVAELMATPSIVDARNLLDPKAIRRHGFTYEGIGRT
ncbi:MAG: UDP-glucose/GDP-mannose dehydrogenase family protein [Actinomycetes bacterium]